MVRGTGHPRTFGRTATLRESSKIPTCSSTIVGQAAAQVPTLIVQITVVVVLILASKAIKEIKATREVFINSLVSGISNNNLGIRVT